MSKKTSPKPKTGKKMGRPLLGTKRRVRLMTMVDPDTLERLEKIGPSMGQAIDKLVAGAK